MEDTKDIEIEEGWSTHSHIKDLFFDTVNTLSNSLYQYLSSTKTVSETSDQHKYARIAEAAYNYKDYVQLEKVLGNSLTNNFKRNEILSNEETSVFFDPDSRETVVAFRGTTNSKDVATDGKVLLGIEKDSSRYKQSEDILAKVLQFYGKDGLITLTGHSLGGGIALTLGEKYDLVSRTYNPAVSIDNIRDSFQSKYQKNKSEQIIYRTANDPVSVGALLSSNRNVSRKVVHVLPHPKNLAVPLLIGDHFLDNFYDNKAKVNPLNKTLLNVQKGNNSSFNPNIFDKVLLGAQLAYVMKDYLGIGETENTMKNEMEQDINIKGDKPPVRKRRTLELESQSKRGKFVDIIFNDKVNRKKQKLLVDRYYC